MIGNDRHGDVGFDLARFGDQIADSPVDLLQRGAGLGRTGTVHVLIVIQADQMHGHQLRERDVDQSFGEARACRIAVRIVVERRSEGHPGVLFEARN